MTPAWAARSTSPRYAARMTEQTYPLKKWRWRVQDPIRPGRRYLTRHHMTESEAIGMDPQATREPGTLMTITGPAVSHSTRGRGRGA